MAWSNLPIDLFRCISLHLSIKDFYRLSAVCTSWNFVVTNCALLEIQCLPALWLLLSNNNVEEASNTLTLCELTIEREDVAISCYNRFSSMGSHIYGRRCFGSKDGWLVTLDKTNLQPRLFNPITRAEILLPSLLNIPNDQGNVIEPKYAPDGSIKFFSNEIFPEISMDNFRDLYFHKIIVSSNHSSESAVVIYGFKKALALARPEDHAWVLGPQLHPYSTMDNEQFEDVCYHEENQRFYAITNFSIVLSFDIIGQNVELICPHMPSPFWRTEHLDCMYYIILLSGTLTRIERVIDVCIDSYHNAETIGFNIFKFVPADITSSCSPFQWIPINDLGDHSLFVGCNQTFSLHHTIAPGIKPNCIYFADHLSNMVPGYVDCDVGLYDLQNNSIQYILWPYPRTNWPPSIWFTPSLS